MAVLLLISALIAYILYRRVSSYAHPDGSAPKVDIVIDGTAAEEGLHYGKASLNYQGPLALLHTEGSAHEVGAQHGRLLAHELKTLHSQFQQNVDQSVDKDGLLGKRLHNIRLRWRWRALDDGIPGHQLVELAGLIRGAAKSGVDLSYEDLVRQSALLDVGQAAEGSSGVSLWTIARALTMLVPLQSELGNRLVVARTLSLPGAADGGDAARTHPLLHVSHPNDALAYASLGWPGLVGVVSGVNNRKIGVFLHFAKTTDVRINREAQPSALIAKEILENAQTLDEAISILKHAKSLGAAIFVLVDGNEQKWAVVERTPSKLGIRRGVGAQVLVDDINDKKLKDDPIADRSRRMRPMLDRLKRAKQLVRKANASPVDVAAILRDQKSSEGAALVFGHRAALNDLESVHTAIFDINGMVVWVAESGDASGRFHAIDLRHAFAPKSKSNQAPPQGIPAVDDSSPTSIEKIRRARQHLRQARRARDRGSLRRARELAALALARAPMLPEALLLAGTLARDDKDDLSARALLQRFLELGADDLRAKEQVEAWLGGP